MEEGRFDGIFMTVIQQTKGIDGFFNECFGFLRRKTDFFKNKEAAEKIIVDQCSKNFLIFEQTSKLEEENQKKKKEREEERKKKLEKEKLEKEKLEKEKKDKENSEKEILEKEKIGKEELEKEKNPESDNKDKKDDEKTDDNEKPPIGNGGSTDKYTWTQTLEELHMYIPVDESIKGKNCKVEIAKVAVNGNAIIDGEWADKIHVDGSVWTLESSTYEFSNMKKYIHLSIEKWQTEWHWWDCAVKGDPKINTQKINPEASSISDLKDGEMKAQVEKMMFDMKQKQMGLPSSDELKKKDMLKDFMKAHPEMDFSKCKFN